MQCPLTSAAWENVGGNSPENWSSLRFLPFITGSKIPEAERAWQVLLVHKDIVELVVGRTEQTICYLNSKNHFLPSFLTGKSNPQTSLPGALSTAGQIQRSTGVSVHNAV